MSCERCLVKLQCLGSEDIDVDQRLCYALQAAVRELVKEAARRKLPLNTVDLQLIDTECHDDDFCDMHKIGIELIPLATGVWQEEARYFHFDSDDPNLESVREDWMQGG